MRRRLDVAMSPKKPNFSNPLFHIVSFQKSIVENLTTLLLHDTGFTLRTRFERLYTMIDNRALRLRKVLSFSLFDFKSDKKLFEKPQIKILLCWFSDKIPNYAMLKKNPKF